METTANEQSVQSETIPESYKVKIDGSESEVSLDDLKATYQKERSADKRFQEAAEIRKSAEAKYAETEELRRQLEEFVEHARKNPKDMISKLGHDPRELAQQILLAELEEEAQSADPNLRRIAQLEAKLNKFEEATENAAKEKRDREEQERLEAERREEAKVIDELDRSIHSALEELGLIKNGKAPAELIADIAEQMLIESKHSKKQIAPKEAFVRAKTSFSKRLQSMTKHDPSSLVEILPEEYLEAVAEQYLAKRKSKSIPSLGISSQQKPTPQNTRDSKIYNEVMEYMKSGA